MKPFKTLLFTFLIPVLGVSQDCSQVYRFNISDKASYSTSCGTQEGSDWTVNKNSCNFYSPILNTGESPEKQPRRIDIRMRLTNSGTLDEKDFAWIFYYVDGKITTTKTLRGDQVEGVINYKDSIEVPSNSNFKLRIALVCDEADEYWRISNGDLTACVRAFEGEASQSQEPVMADKITVLKERNVVRLMWTAPGNPDGNYFMIERSKNGSQFEFAGYVKDNRNGTTSSKYSFIDNGTFKPETWYRISHVDLSGKSSPFGKPVSVTF